MERHTYNVSAKAALYSPDGSQVLLAFYTHDMYGLPGGHLEGREDPEVAIRRELMEELGLDYDAPLIKRDFFFHDSGKLILGFVGTLDTDVSLHPDGEELAAARWTGINKVRDGSVDVGSYKDFVLNNAPYEAAGA